MSHSRNTDRVRVRVRPCQFCTPANNALELTPRVAALRVSQLAYDVRRPFRIREGYTLLLQGPPGVGKTHLALALGVRAVENGFSAAFFRLEELLLALRRDADLPPSRLRRRNCNSVALVIIDEAGFEPMTRKEAGLLFRLVSYRYGRGSILITTNKGIREWPEILADT